MDFTHDQLALWLLGVTGSTSSGQFSSDRAMGTRLGDLVILRRGWDGCAEFSSG